MSRSRSIEDSGGCGLARAEEPTMTSHDALWHHSTITSSLSSDSITSVSSSASLLVPTTDRRHAHPPRPPIKKLTFSFPFEPIHYFIITNYWLIQFIQINWYSYISLYDKVTWLPLLSHDYLRGEAPTLHQQAIPASQIKSLDGSRLIKWAGLRAWLTTTLYVPHRPACLQLHHTSWSYRGATHYLSLDEN